MTEIKSSEDLNKPQMPLSEVVAGRILVVDDEPSLRNILVQSLKMENYDAQSAGSGAEALEKLAVEDVDILLSDLMMPEMDGLALLQRALVIDPHLVCIMMTGQGTIQTAVDAMKRGAFDYVLKPFRLQTMMPVLTRAMNTRHLLLENVHLREAVGIHELSQTIAFTMDPQAVLSKLADAAMQQTQADEVSVLLPTADGKELYVAVVRGEWRERLLGEHIPFDRGIASWVGHELKPVILNGQVHDHRFKALWPRPEIRSSVSLPMQVANKLVGILNLNLVARPRRFTVGQMKALSILAGTAAAALESASLYDQVQRAEENYRSIFENAVDGIFRATADAVRFTSVNPAMAQMFAYDSPAEMISAVEDVTKQLGLDPARRDEALNLLGKHDVLENFEACARRKDGSEIWTSANVRAIRDAKGELEYLDGIVQDITERKRAQEALRESEEKYRTILERMEEGYAEVDLKGSYVFVNDSFCRISGRSRSELLGVNYRELFDREQRQLLFDAYHKVYETGEPITGFEYEVTWKDGTRRVVEESVTLKRDAEGQPVGFTGTRRDCTERRQAEKALRESEERYRDLVENAHDIIFSHDLEGKFTSVNRAGEQITGYTHEECLSLNIMDTVAPEHVEIATEMRAQKLTGQKVTSYEVDLIAKDGKRIAVEVNTKLIVRDGVPVGVHGIARDITERKRTETELRFQKTLLESQSEASIDGILVVSEDMRIRSFNKRFVELWGIPEPGPDETDDITLGRVLDKVARSEEFLARVDYLYQHREEESREEIALKDGRTFDRYSAPIKSHDKEYYGRVWFFRDITERKRAEQELRESEERYRDLIENAQDIIYSHDLKGNYLSSNKAGEEITGYTMAESLKLNLQQTVAPEYVEKAREMLARKLAGEEITAYELELVAKDGHRVPIEVNTRLVMQDGVPVAVTGVARDITERKRAEVELRRLAAAVEETADSVVITDKDGNIQYVNPAFERITGYAKEEVLNQNPRFLKGGKTDPAVYKELWDTISHGDVWIGHLINRKKDGTLFEERVTISAIYGESKEIVNYVAVKQDVSDMIQLEDQLRQSQKMEAIGQLAGGVAHDFNNLLTAINGYSSLALQKIEGNPTVRNYLEEIKKAGDRAANLTRQLLAFGRKQILQPMPISLNDIVTDMNKMLRRLIGEDIVLTAKLDPALKRIKADPGQIEQVLVNLVVNARDAMPQGGNLTIETASITLDQHYASTHVGVQVGDYVLLAVSDTGTGMSAEVRRHIFEPFFTTKEKGKGTGLGLSTVYGIVNQSGGSIWVYSELNRGTTFKVYLPALDLPTKTSESKAAAIVIPRGSETVLLVEDEEVVRGLACQILEEAGYRVLVASQGQEAIRLGNQHAQEINLLLTDVVMPGTGGKEVADRLSAARPGIKVLFMSGYTDEAIVHHGILDANVQFIQKPFTPAGLAIKVRAVLDANGKAPKN